MQTKRSVFKMKDSKEQILNTALNLFLQKGFKEVTMRELVEGAGLSKGAFYHYFKSKEDVFEEVVMRFARALSIPNYDALSTTSLQEFYRNWLQHFSQRKSSWGQSASGESAVIQNHYYLIFDGIRLLPAFRDMFYKEQEREMAAWIKIIDIARESKEISTDLPSRQIASMFAYVSDGLSFNLLMNNKIAMLDVEAVNAWDSMYALMKT